MGMSVTVKKTNFDPRKLKEGVCRVGFFETARYDDNTPVAAVARWNEYGTPKIPMRPFVRPALHQNRSQLIAILRSRYKQAMKDNKNTMEVLFDFGEMCTEMIQDQIRTTTTPPNAPSTIRRKGKNTPLRDTLVMFHSVRHKEEELLK